MRKSASYCPCKEFHLSGKTEQVIAGLLSHVLPSSPLRLDHADSSSSFPPSLWIYIRNILWIINNPLFADFQASMPFVHCPIALMLDVSKLLSLGQITGLFSLFGKRAMIPFER